MSGFRRAALVALLLPAVFLEGPPADARGSLRFTDGPRVLSESPAAGEPVRLSASAVFPGEEWIGFHWDFEGDGREVSDTGALFGASARSEVEHVFVEAGRHKVICTAYHGFKSGVFGVGPWKYRLSRSVLVDVAPGLPLRIGVLTIDGGGIEAENGSTTRYRITGAVRINGGLALDNPVVVDLAKQTVSLTGSLALPGAGEYAEGLSFLENVTLDAATGGFGSVDLPNLNAEFEVAGFGAKVENVRIVGAGLELDFEVRIPRLSEDPDGEPDEPPGADDPIDLSDVFPPEPKPDQLAALSFKKFRIDAVSPYLHALGETKATISNVPLGFAGTKFGIDTLEAGIDPSQDRYFGTLKLKLPTERGIGGTFEIREGQWEKVGFSLAGKLPFWTFTGGLDAIYVDSLSASVVNLAVLAEEPERVPMIQAGVFDPVSGAVSEDGVSFAWGPSTNLLGRSVVTPIKLVGACTFDPFWNVSAAGQVSIFEDPFGERMRILGAQGAYRAPQDGLEAGTWYLRGDLVFDPLFRLQADCTTSFDPADFHVTATAMGNTLVPEEHWISMILPELTGTVRWVWRIAPHEVNRLSFTGYADVPSTFAVLREVLQGKGVGFSYDFATGEYGWQVVHVHTVASPGKAVARTGVVADGAGAGGLVVTLRRASGAGAFDLRTPDGTLLTPAAADGVSVDFHSGPTWSMYVLASAPDGTYTAEFDDASLGVHDVEFFSPRPLPEVTVVGVGADVSLGRYETLAVPFTTAGVASDAVVRAYLDDDDVPGGGGLAALGTAGSGSLDLDVSKLPAGDYRLVVEVLGGDGLPVGGEAEGRVTVRDHLSLSVTRGSVVDSPKAGRDKLALGGTFAFDGPRPALLFDPEAETLRLTVGGSAAPTALRVGPGDPGWKASRRGALKWRSPRGARPAVALALDPGKGRFKVKVARTDFRAPPANPIRFDLRFGNDAASDTRDWTESAPGRFVR